MPTFNQLVRTGRQVSEKKAKAPALLKGWNSKKRVAQQLKLQHLKNLTLL